MSNVKTTCGHAPTVLVHNALGVMVSDSVTVGTYIGGRRYVEGAWLKDGRIMWARPLASEVSILGENDEA